MLSEAKKTSQEVNAKMTEKEVVEKEIDVARAGYVPVAFRASSLYFCVADLSTIDPMYQFSLQWFVSLYEQGIDDAPASDDAGGLQLCLTNINDFFTEMLYGSVCRSLFEKHKLLFSFLLTVNILKGKDQIDLEQYRHLVQVGQVPRVEAENPTDWLDENAWRRVLALARTCRSSPIIPHKKAPRRMGGQDGRVSKADCAARAAPRQDERRTAGLHHARSSWWCAAAQSASRRT